MRFHQSTLAETLAILPPGPRRYVEPLTRGSLRLGLYAPVGHDPQQPHSQDEIYVIIRGDAVLVQDGRRARCATGDALFVAAGEPHHFEEMSEDFAAWVVFYGPQGGEMPR